VHLLTAVYFRALFRVADSNCFVSFGTLPFFFLTKGAFSMRVNSYRTGFTPVSLMIRYGQFVFLLVVFSAVVGCGGQGGVVATDDEMKAHVEKYGDQKLDPAASTPLTD
jgi:hypothetical protein